MLKDVLAVLKMKSDVPVMRRPTTSPSCQFIILYLLQVMMMKKCFALLDIMSHIASNNMALSAYTEASFSINKLSEKHSLCSDCLMAPYLPPVS